MTRHRQESGALVQTEDRSETKCAIYCRVSTAGQREQQTIGAQLASLPEHAERMGWQVVGTYVDDGESAESIEGRPEFQRLLMDARQGRFDLLLVAAIDRITRSTNSGEGGYIFDTLRDAGVQIATATQLIDLNDDEQSFAAGISREVARYEKLKIRARTLMGQIHWARQGYLALGSLPFGYRREKAPSGRSVAVVDEARAATYRRIVDAFMVEGLSINKICLQLNREKVPSPKGNHWFTQTVGDIFRNPAYKGEFTVFKNHVRVAKGLGKRLKNRGATVLTRAERKRPCQEHIIIPVPKVIEPEQWEALQKRLANSRRNPNHYLSKRDEHGRPAVDTHLLRGVAQCGLCGGKLRAEPFVGPGGRRFYSCHWSPPTNALREGRERCPLPWILAETAEDAAYKLLYIFLGMPSQIVRLVDEATGDKRQRQRAEAELAGCRNERTKLLKHQARLLDEELAGRYAPEVIAEKATECRARLKRLDNQIARLEETLTGLNSQQEAADEFDDELSFWRRNRHRLRHWLKTASVPQKRMVLEALVNPDAGGTVVVRPPSAGGRTEIQLRFSPERVLAALKAAGALDPDRETPPSGELGGTHGTTSQGAKVVAR